MKEEKDLIIDLEKDESFPYNTATLFGIAQTAHFEGYLQNDPDKILFAKVAKSLLSYLHCIPRNSNLITVFVHGHMGFYKDEDSKKELAELLKKVNDDERAIAKLLDKHKDEMLDQYELYSVLDKESK